MVSAAACKTAPSDDAVGGSLESITELYVCYACMAASTHRESVTTTDPGAILSSTQELLPASSHPTGP